MISPREAADTLKDVQRAERRSGTAFGYSKAAPHLILWGTVWVLGYGASDLWPQRMSVIWLSLVALGVIAGFWIGRGGAPVSAAKSLRFFGLVPIFFAFITATYAVMWPVSGLQQAAFIPLLVATIYASLGLWLGVRFILLGVLVAALTLGGFFYLHEHFLLWMAFVGGGALILSGFWFRKV